MTTLTPSVLNGSSSFLQVTRITIKACMTSDIGQIRPLITELAAHERPEKSNYNVVTTLAPSILIGLSCRL